MTARCRRSEFRLWLGSLAFSYRLEFCTLKTKTKKPQPNLGKIARRLYNTGWQLLQPPRSNRALAFLTKDKAERWRSNCLIFLGFHNYVELEWKKKQWWMIQFQYYTTRSHNIPRRGQGHLKTKHWLLYKLDIQASLCSCEICGFMIFRTCEMTHLHNKTVVVVVIVVVVVVEDNTVMYIMSCLSNTMLTFPVSQNGDLFMNNELRSSPFNYP